MVVIRFFPFIVFFLFLTTSLVYAVDYGKRAYGRGAYGFGAKFVAAEGVLQDTKVVEPEVNATEVLNDTETGAEEITVEETTAKKVKSTEKEGETTAVEVPLEEKPVAETEKPTLPFEQEIDIPGIGKVRLPIAASLLPVVGAVAILISIITFLFFRPR